MDERLFHSAKESREFNFLYTFNTFYLIRWFLLNKIIPLENVRVIPFSLLFSFYFFFFFFFIKELQN